MIAVIFSIASLATVLVLLLYFFARADCDVTLFIVEKFGIKPRVLKNKVVWITGASSGIGEALAYELAVIGSKLVLSGTNESKLNEVRKKCLAMNPTLKESDVLIVSFNMKEIDKHEEKMKQVLEHFDQIDILVNNAGRSQRSSFEEIELEVHKELFEINVFGLINLTKLVMKHWYKTNFKGQLVVTSSITGKLGAPYSTSYTASKHALHGYFEAIRLESYCRGLSVTIICPGPVFSAILQNAVRGKVGERVGGAAFSNDSKRMTAERCAYLMSVAIANKVDETWITEQPFLTIFYTTQYLPSLTRSFLCRYLTKERASELRDGK
ncbi:dehydrogenase/reductase SDR family member 7-like protein [Leptotrombidium deliense]|uniref:Dehydrogenase/reductase SDR family member 7-like protein n=1 Tax=Leptotrombidium deliense TaxID=299467 RepID=A0A443SJW0_9ACAR|nr:dehydrogenase/reductase SDR family member 7-like protein [Leptotrombidium deliense]